MDYVGAPCVRVELMGCTRQDCHGNFIVYAMKLIKCFKKNNLLVQYQVFVLNLEQCSLVINI